eukprot:CAMPEP_0119486626 /NCGR_PEP_ID=MMETSP1344-20130328/12976_1 /TAXON_ID=236787 /ORGANISM="Florenciella parvula, Strain CCMP2471" /LENGTH=69 /DNA_ID=CAMNT_0007521411 /DNA_START=364 /DNA_END=570 /DNA_ORIENTATION=+
MTQWTPESQPAVNKCHAPYYMHNKWLTGYRLSHWLSGSCTIDYGSVSVIPLWLESSGDLEMAAERLHLR